MPELASPTPAPRRARAPRGGGALRRIIAAALLAAAAGAAPARADICKYGDAEGNVHYTNVAPEKGWKRLGCTSGGDDMAMRRPGSATSGGASARNAATPSGFPRVDAETQKGRDDVRRKVLTDELASEQKLLAEAKAAYADGAPVPLPEEKADAEKYRARIARLRQGVGLHERNIEALKKEIAAVK
jgi:hypothetical protein